MGVLTASPSARNNTQLAAHLSGHSHPPCDNLDRVIDRVVSLVSQSSMLLQISPLLVPDGGQRPTHGNRAVVTKLAPPTRVHNN